MRPLGRALLLATALGVAACDSSGGGDGLLPPEADVLLSVTIAERVTLETQSASKRITLNVRGRTDPTGDALTGAVESVQVGYTHPDGTSIDYDTLDPTVKTGRDASAVARRRLAGHLVGQEIGVRWADEARRCFVEGPAGAIARAMENALEDRGADPEALDAALSGLLPLLDDVRLSNELTAAGLAMQPAGIGDQLVVQARDVPVVIPGVRIGKVVVTGQAGQQLNAAAVLRMTGAGVDESDFAGDPGPEPPEMIGAVVLEDVTASSETLYGVERGAPERGNIHVAVPHRNGPVVERSVEFSLLVTE